MAIFNFEQKAVVWYGFEIEAPDLETAKEYAQMGQGENYWQGEHVDFLEIYACLDDDQNTDFFGDDVEKGAN